ncbi:MAG TPA: GntR family transcriptional regulator, partial [Fimbriimonadaceae bacterium]|nr:GntR family transcriptional regulator [Fimbriimonadaceae bacterium]
MIVCCFYMNKEQDSSPSQRTGFREIAAKMQAGIEAGKLPVGQYLPTERELQEQFGASRSTVRKALTYLVECGFGQSVPNRGVIALRGARAPKTRNVALIDGGSYVMRVLTVELGEMLQSRSFDPVHMGGRTDYPLEYALQRALDNDFAGAIVWSYKGFVDLEFLHRTSERFPLVALDHRIEGAETDLVTFDHEGAAMEATE